MITRYVLVTLNAGSPASKAVHVQVIRCELNKVLITDTH